MRDGQTGYARAAGIAYLVIFACGIYAEFVVRSSLIVDGDAAATAANLVAAETAYRGALASELVMLCADVVVALALYMVLRPAGEGLALMAAFFRLVHAAIVGVGLLALFLALRLLGSDAYLTTLDQGAREALALVLLETHAYGYAVGLFFFAFACALVGWLIVTSRAVPAVLGFMLIVAGLGYLTDSFARTLMSDYGAYESVFGAIVLLPAFVGELSFSLWLVVKGVAPEVPRAAVTEPAR